MAPSQSLPFDATQIHKAVTALNQLYQQQQKQQVASSVQSLFEEDPFLHLIVTLRRIPAKKRTQPYVVRIPHSLWATVDDADACLFCKDPRTDYQNLKNSNTKVSKVINISKLRTDFKTYEDKRKLCDSYDYFLSDARIIPMLPPLLGKAFFKKKKQPVPVNLEKAGKREAELVKVRDSTVIHLPSGSTFDIKVGRQSFKPEQISENVTEVLSYVVAKLLHSMKGWTNIQALHLKYGTTTALPIYSSLPAVPTTASEADSKKKRTREADDEVTAKKVKAATKNRASKKDQDEEKADEKQQEEEEKEEDDDDDSEEDEDFDSEDADSSEEDDSEEDDSEDDSDSDSDSDSD